MTQMNYLNRALDTYNTAIVSSIYYVFFTVLTIAASVIMYKDWQQQTANQICSELTGFVLIVVGVIVLHVTKDAQPGCEDGLARLVGTVRPAALAELGIARGDSAYMRVRTRGCALSPAPCCSAACRHSLRGHGARSRGSGGELAGG